MPLGRGEILPRAVNRKSASVFVIACEGAVTEKEYFEGLVEVFNLQRVQVKILDAAEGGDAGNSSPEQVLRRMDSFVKAKEARLKLKDEFWLVMDVDHHARGRHRHNLVRVLQQAAQSKYSVAISNARIELWLLLHLEEFPAPADCTRRGWMERRISTLAGFNPKNGVDVASLKAGVTAAIERAKAKDAADMEADPDALLPALPGTHVYRLMERIREVETRPTSPPPF